MRSVPALAVICLAVAGCTDDSDGGQSTPYEAACDMLDDGDTATEAFDILVELEVSAIAASRAVNEAIADGCGN